MNLKLWFIPSVKKIHFLFLVRESLDEVLSTAQPESVKSGNETLSVILHHSTCCLCLDLLKRLLNSLGQCSELASLVLSSTNQSDSFVEDGSADLGRLDSLHDVCDSLGADSLALLVSSLLLSKLDCLESLNDGVAEGSTLSEVTCLGDSNVGLGESGVGLSDDLGGVDHSLAAVELCLVDLALSLEDGVDLVNKLSTLLSDESVDLVCTKDVCDESEDAEVGSDNKLSVDHEDLLGEKDRRAETNEGVPAVLLDDLLQAAEEGLLSRESGGSNIL